MGARGLVDCLTCGLTAARRAAEVPALVPAARPAAQTPTQARARSVSPPGGALPTIAERPPSVDDFSRLVRPPHAAWPAARLPAAPSTPPGPRRSA